MLSYLPTPVATGGCSPFSFKPHGHYAPSPISYADYEHHSRLEELRRAEASIQAAIAEEETRRRRQFEQRVALELALRQQAEEREARRRRQQAQERAEARLVAAAIAHRAEAARQERARQIALARQAYEQEQLYRRLLEARQQQQQQQHRLRQQLEARRQRDRQAEIAPALVQLVLDIFAAQQPEDQPTHEASAAPANAPVTAPASTPAPAAEGSSSIKVAEPVAPAATGSTESLEEAAKVLQRRFRRHAARRSALDQLSSLATDLVSRRRAFAAPAELHFQSSPAASSDATIVPSSSAPASQSLAFDKSNKAFLGYEDFLVSLLSKIDAVESNGDKVVQRARKELVRQVEKELSRLDELKQQEWERQSGASSRAESDAGEIEEDKATVETADKVEGKKTAAESDFAATSDPLEKEESTATTHAPAATAETPIDTAITSPSEQPTSEGADEPVDTASDAAPPSRAEVAASSAEIESATTASDSAPTDTEPAPTSTPLEQDHSSSASEAGDYSSSDEQLDTAIEEVLKRAKALGEQVEALEQADEQAPVPDFEQQAAHTTSRGGDTTESTEQAAEVSSTAESTQQEASLAVGENKEKDFASAIPSEKSPTAPEGAKDVEASKEDAAPAKEDAKSEAGTEDFEML
ncbi:hypothetical protein JCM10908_000580 [Rhodotorula pacifica]|uniref:uncharacterized protein n=1 Tax=Rhodotorula pacifica TaxID=1495444 RepID=UPI00317D6D0E